MKDVHKALLRDICRRHPDLVLRSSRSEPWASVTFTGERHVYAFAPGEPPTGLSEAEFTLRGHVVADLAVEQNGEEIVVEALTIEAG